VLTRSSTELHPGTMLQHHCASVRLRLFGLERFNPGRALDVRRPLRGYSIYPFSCLFIYFTTRLQLAPTGLTDAACNTATLVMFCLARWRQCIPVTVPANVTNSTQPMEIDVARDICLSVCEQWSAACLPVSQNGTADTLATTTPTYAVAYSQFVAITTKRIN